MYFPLRGSQTTIWLLGSKPGLISNNSTKRSSGQLTLEGEVADLEALVRALLGGDDGRVADEGVVDTRVGHKVGLELVQINVEGTVETQGRGDGADDLGDQAVEVLVVGPRDIQAATADIVNRLVVNKESAVGVLNGAVGREDSVVGLNNGGGNARSRVDGELKLALLAVVGGKALKEESTETGTCTSTKGVEDKETLERRAVVW